MSAFRRRLLSLRKEPANIVWAKKYFFYETTDSTKKNQVSVENYAEYGAWCFTQGHTYNVELDWEIEVLENTASSGNARISCAAVTGWYQLANVNTVGIHKAHTSQVVPANKSSSTSWKTILVCVSDIGIKAKFTLKNIYITEIIN